jgi:hypothetical protein
VAPNTVVVGQTCFVSSDTVGRNVRTNTLAYFVAAPVKEKVFTHLALEEIHELGTML